MIKRFISMIFGFITMLFVKREALQMFSYNPQAQPANWTGADALAPEDKEYYDKQLIRYAKPQLVHANFGQKRNIPQRSGNKIEFRCFAPLEKQLTPLTEGVTPDPQSLSVSKIEATVKQYGGFVELTDTIKLTSIDPIVTETVQLIGDQAGRTMDTLVRDVLHTGTNVYYADRTVNNAVTATNYRYQLDATAGLTVELLESVYAELKSVNAPQFDGYYILIAHPKALYSLKRDEDFRKANLYTNEVKKLYNGEVGEIAGFRIIENSEAKIIKADDLLSTSRTLKVASAVSTATATIPVSQTLVANALKDRYVLLNGTYYKIMSNTTSAIVLDSSTTASANDVIYPGEGGADGIAIFSCLALGKNAYGVTEIDGDALRTIIKGPQDPLEQRSTVGWKGRNATEILIPEYLFRIECGGKKATANLAAN